MKRPEGFGPPSAPQGTPGVPTPAVRKQAEPRQAAPKQAVPKQAVQKQADPLQAAPKRAEPTPAGPTQAGPKQAAPKRPASLRSDDRSPVTTQAQPKTRPKAQPHAEVVAERVRDAQRSVKRTARDRKRFERGEVKRFTRRSRSRRTIVLTLSSLLVVLVAVLLVAVYSPLLALRTITVEGANRVSATEISAAVDGQLGTPLALIDYDTITGQLAKFPLIRSYVTELVPPGTLVVHIVERAPVGAVVNGAKFDLVDPAGIVVQSSAQRPDGVPLIDVGGKPPTSAAYRSVVEVLLSLPASLLAQVDTITATTKDDVTFVLRGVGQSVLWGSSERSAYKASVLAGILKQSPDELAEYDVSAPGSVVVTPR